MNKVVIIVLVFIGLVVIPLAANIIFVSNANKWDTYISLNERNWERQVVTIETGKVKEIKYPTSIQENSVFSFTKPKISVHSVNYQSIAQTCANVTNVIAKQINISGKQGCRYEIKSTENLFNQRHFAYVMQFEKEAITIQKRIQWL